MQLDKYESTVLNNLAKWTISYGTSSNLFDKNIKLKYYISHNYFNNRNILVNFVTKEKIQVWQNANYFVRQMGLKNEEDKPAWMKVLFYHFPTQKRCSLKYFWRNAFSSFYVAWIKYWVLVSAVSWCNISPSCFWSVFVSWVISATPARRMRDNLDSNDLKKRKHLYDDGLIFRFLDKILCSLLQFLFFSNK